MKNKKLKSLLFAIATVVSTIGTAGCASSKINEIIAVEESVVVKIGESDLLSNYYEIDSKKDLSASEKQCTAVSSDESVVKINGRKFEAVNSGTATITITSAIDESKTCTFEVVVSKVFIDRDLTYVYTEDDFSNEWDDETGTGKIVTNSGYTNYYFIKDIDSTKWYVETDITVHEIKENDRFPKIGIFTRANNSKDEETTVAFFLNACIGLNDVGSGENIEYGQDNINWNEFGVTEVIGGHWAWEEGITNSLARHHDYAWTTSSNITYNTKFKLGVARNGMDFHVYINDSYAGSYQLDPYMTILMENGEPLSSKVGFFQFNSVVTYSNYYATSDESKLESVIPESPIYTDFLED